MWLDALAERRPSRFFSGGYLSHGRWRPELAIAAHLQRGRHIDGRRAERLFDAENGFVVGISSPVGSNPGGCWRREWCPAPASYCVAAPNSAGSGALIGSSGNANLGENAFVLSVTGAVANQPGLFYYGASQVQLPFGDG